MIAREGRDKVVNRETHNYWTEEREEEEEEKDGEGEKVKYRALIDLQLKGNQGCPTKRAHGQFPSGPSCRPASVLSASTSDALRQLTPHHNTILDICPLTCPAQRSSEQIEGDSPHRGILDPFFVCPFTASCPRAFRTPLRQSLQGKIDPARLG